jgi:hypothetical protein
MRCTRGNAPQRLRAGRCSRNAALHRGAVGSCVHRATAANPLKGARPWARTLQRPATTARGTHAYGSVVRLATNHARRGAEDVAQLLYARASCTLSSSTEYGVVPSVRVSCMCVFIHTAHAAPQLRPRTRVPLSNMRTHPPPHTTSPSTSLFTVSTTRRRCLLTSRNTPRLLHAPRLSGGAHTARGAVSREPRRLHVRNVRCAGRRAGTCGVEQRSARGGVFRHGRRSLVILFLVGGDGWCVHVSANCSSCGKVRAHCIRIMYCRAPARATAERAAIRTHAPSSARSRLHRCRAVAAPGRVRAGPQRVQPCAAPYLQPAYTVPGGEGRATPWPGAKQPATEEDTNERAPSHEHPAARVAGRWASD